MRYLYLCALFVSMCAFSSCKDKTKDGIFCDDLADEAERLACRYTDWLACEDEADAEAREDCQRKDTDRWRYCKNLKDPNLEDICSHAQHERWKQCEKISHEKEHAQCERAKELQGACDHLFGLPTENTGLTSEQCKPVIDLPDLQFEEPIYSSEYVEKLDAAVLLTDMRETFYDVREDPYPHQEDYLGQHTENTVCGILMDEEIPNGYHLKTYEDQAAAVADGAEITHFGPCGLCSTMQDLAVYIREPDLTAPVRACGVKGLGKPAAEAEQLARECLHDVGFSDGCIDIWYWDIENTKRECMATCIKNNNLTKPHHNADLSLNACVQCDEDQSGPLFKVISGRTRRNSGLSSALCRPCQTVQPVDHHYTWPE